MGHEFVGEIVGHGPGVDAARFPIGARVTSIPFLLTEHGGHVIGGHPDARARCVLFECVGAPGFIEKLIAECAHGSQIVCAGGWYTGDSVSVTPATRKGVTVQFGGAPGAEDWFGQLE